MPQMELLEHSHQQFKGITLRRSVNGLMAPKQFPTKKKETHVPTRSFRFLMTTKKGTKTSKAFGENLVSSFGSIHPTCSAQTDFLFIVTTNKVDFLVVRSGV